MYTVPPNIDPDKIFLINRSDLEGKLEVSYHLPSIRALEDKVRKKSRKTLKDFIVKIASGATPSVLEEEKYYSNAEEGIPFLRVQNLQINGELNLEDVKFINEQTHENYLKRSQVKGGNLLVKITGVGRMAIASVAPDDFIGNTNQHMVVINTGSKETSEYLANYLNLDFVEKLATRRATGGTRPALDYAALKSIPIIEDIDISLLKNAELIKKDKEFKAKSLLDSIDDYLLKELDITLPEKDNSLEARMFTTNFSEVVNDRYDPKLYDEITIGLKKAIGNVDKFRFALKPLKEFVIGSVSGDWGIEEEEDIEVDNYTKCLVIRATEFNNNYNLSLENSRVKYRLIENNKLKKLDVKNGDLLIEKSGGSSDQPVGRVAIITPTYMNKYKLAYSNFIHKIRVDNTQINSEYLFCYLKTIHNIKLTEAMQSQTNGIRNLIMRSYLEQNIVLPVDKKGNIDLEKQERIAEHIQNIRSKARNLQIEANEELEKAKQQIENIILN
ncbi:restriction endonuclease subunit S [Chryseobacterium sp. KBW03]|uniref:restriction endonuclease subunit S n=1 Tax=Chryseobacterium sp. KBW03 TaxID=2153362 RepID=UPI0016239106|nr:restriction endonuclease subunit S [Chryseobacterium sp. KBW03]